MNDGKNEITDCLFLNNTINNVSGVLFRKDKYIEAGYADHSMTYCGDWFLYLRMLLISDIAYISSPLNILRIHAGSSCNDYLRKSKYLIEVLMVYKFILARIYLMPQKKFTMIKNLLELICRKFYHGYCPEIKEIIKTIKFIISVIKTFFKFAL
jgi:hypothetical protein